MNLFQLKPKSLLGIDITATAVKLIEISRKHNHYKVESFARVAVSPQAIIDKTIKDPAAVTSAIKTAWQHCASKTKIAAIAMSNSLVFSKTLSLPLELNEDAIENQILAEANQFIPYAIDDIYLDFKIIEQNKNNPELVDVLVIASRRHDVDQWLDVITDAGLTVKIVDVEAYALQRAYDLMCSNTNDKDKYIAVVDVNTDMIVLTILYNHIVIYTRQEITLSASMANNLTENYNVIAQQIQQALQFFYSTGQYNEVEKIILVGEYATINDFATEIAEYLQITVVIASPFANVDIAPQVNKSLLQANASALMLSCGLSLRGCNND